MRRSAAALVLLSALAWIGCSSPGELRQSTLDSSALQLRSAERSGHPTEIVFENEAIDAREAVERWGPIDSSTTYLVLTQTDAQIVWSERLEGAVPGAERVIIGKWVVPYLREDDLDNALKGFVFGYLETLYGVGQIEWDEAIVPFLPPRSSDRHPHPTAVMLALLVALLVVKASNYLD
jgi:hypothetical protein